MGGSKHRIIWPAAIIISLFIHLATLHSYSLSAPAKTPNDDKIIELVNLPDLDKLKKPAPNTNRNGQIVDLGPPQPNDPIVAPENAKYLSERNMRTDRETIRYSNARTGSPGAAQRPMQSRARRSSEKEARSRELDEEGMLGLSRGAKGEDGAVEVAKADPKSLSKQDLKLSMAELRDVVQGDNGSIDYVPDAVQGDMTSLNSRQYAYASFYNRIKKVIRFYWEPQRAVSMIRWNGSTLETTIRVVIAADGTLESVEVVKSCGFPTVDAAAIRAIRKAAPFYNVPVALLNEQGKLDDTWTFTIFNR